MTAPAPTTAFGPIHAEAATVAVGSTCAPAARPARTAACGCSPFAMRAQAA